MESSAACAPPTDVTTLMLATGPPQSHNVSGMQVVDGFIISALFPVFAVGASIGAAVAAWKQRRAVVVVLLVAAALASAASLYLMWWFYTT